MRPHENAPMVPPRIPAARLLAIVLLVLFASFVPPVEAGTVTIHLFARFVSPTGWSTTPGAESDPGPLLSANQGDRITMEFGSEDGTPHIFWIDYNGNGVVDTGEPESQQFTGTDSFTFDALQPGTFTYWCVIHKPSMRGTWVTNASDLTPPTIASVVPVPSQQAPGGFVNLTAIVADDTAVASVAIHVVGPSLDVNLTMAHRSSDEWYLNRTYASPGVYAFTVWAVDARGNFQSRSGSFSIGAAPEPPFDPGPLLVVAVVAAGAAFGVGIWLRRRRQ